MEALIISITFAVFVAFITLIPKGTHFSEQQLKESQKEIQRLASSK